jgi:TRAP-type uncharacterized transport system fused permease subunit
MKTGWTAMRLGAIKYIVPFFFAYNPALLTHGTWSEVLIATIFATVGIFYLASALENYLWGVGSLKWPQRILLIVGGLLTAFPEMVTTLIGLIMVIIIHGISYLGVRKLRLSKL